MNDDRQDFSQENSIQSLLEIGILTEMTHALLKSAGIADLGELSRLTASDVRALPDVDAAIFDNIVRAMRTRKLQFQPDLDDADDWFDAEIDLYAALGVSQQADIDEIGDRYRLLAKKYHPDTRDRSIVGADDMIIRLNLAYEILSDQEKRNKYDRRRREAWASKKQDTRPARPRPDHGSAAADFTPPYYRPRKRKHRVPMHALWMVPLLFSAGFIIYWFSGAGPVPEVLAVAPRPNSGDQPASNSNGNELSDLLNLYLLGRALDKDLAPFDFGGSTLEPGEALRAPGRSRTSQDNALENKATGEDELLRSILTLPKRDDSQDRRR